MDSKHNGGVIGFMNIIKYLSTSYINIKNLNSFLEKLMMQHYFYNFKDKQKNFIKTLSIIHFNLDSKVGRYAINPRAVCLFLHKSSHFEQIKTVVYESVL